MKETLSYSFFFLLFKQDGCKPKHKIYSKLMINLASLQINFLLYNKEVKTKDLKQ